MITSHTTISPGFTAVPLAKPAEQLPSASLPAIETKKDSPADNLPSFSLSSVVLEITSINLESPNTLPIDVNDIPFIDSIDDFSQSDISKQRTDQQKNDSSVKANSADIEAKNAAEVDATNREKGNEQVTELSKEELAVVRQLQSIDREVRAHEQAHLSAAGSLAKGGPSFDFRTGPDGKRYAVAGEVNIETGSVANDPQATIQRAQQVQRAALAPTNPSAQDRSVAASAANTERQAQADLVQLKSEARIEQQASSVKESNSDDVQSKDNTDISGTTTTNILEPSESLIKSKADTIITDIQVISRNSTTDNNIGGLINAFA